MPPLRHPVAYHCPGTYPRAACVGSTIHAAKRVSPPTSFVRESAFGRLQHRQGIRVIRFLVRSSFAGIVLAMSVVAGAQPYAPGEAVVIPGAEIADWGRV